MVCELDYVQVESTNTKTGSTGAAAATVDGQLLLLWAPGPKSFEFGYDYDGESARSFRPGLDQIWAGVRGIRWLAIGWGTSRIGLNATIVILPLWLVPILAAIPPVRWWRARRREGGRGFAVDAAA